MLAGRARAAILRHGTTYRLPACLPALLARYLLHNNHSMTLTVPLQQPTAITPFLISLALAGDLYGSYHALFCHAAFQNIAFLRAFFSLTSFLPPLPA